MSTGGLIETYNLTLTLGQPANIKVVVILLLGTGFPASWKNHEILEKSWNLKKGQNHAKIVEF